MQLFNILHVIRQQLIKNLPYCFCPESLVWLWFSNIKIPPKYTFIDIKISFKIFSKTENKNILWTSEFTTEEHLRQKHSSKDNWQQFACHPHWSAHPLHLPCCAPVPFAHGPALAPILGCWLAARVLLSSAVPCWSIDNIFAETATFVAFRLVGGN